MSSIEFIPILMPRVHSAYCSILKIGDSSIMLECGWSSDLNKEHLDLVTPHLPSVKMILISQPNLEYCGMLPSLIDNPNFKASVYTTFPVHKMSQMVLYDLALNSIYTSHAWLFTIEKINNAWELITAVKHSQKVHIKEDGLVISPYRAGHSIGGTVWKIAHNMLDLVYAPCFTSHTLKCVPGLDYENIQKPYVLILDATHSSEEPETSQSDRICQIVRDTLLSGGSALIPVDVAGFTMELLQILEFYWDNNRDTLQSFPIVFYAHTSKSTIEFAKSYLEWMTEDILARFEGNRDNPFAFKYITLATSPDELPIGPKCILATPIDCSSGWSRKLLLEYAESEMNSIIFINKPKKDSLPYQVYNSMINSFVDVEETLVVTYEYDPSWANSEDRSTDISENIEKIEETEFETPFSPKLFDEKEFPCFAMRDFRQFHDEYGEALDEMEFEEWETKQEKSQQPKNVLSSNILKTYTQSISFKLQEEERKLKTGHRMSQMIRKQIRFQRYLIEFDGRSDSVSTKLTIAKVQPRKLLLLNASELGLEELRRYSSKISLKSEIYHANQPIILKSGVSIQTTKLSEESYNSLKFLSVDGYELAYIQGEASYEQDQLMFETDQERAPKGHGLYLGQLNMSKFKVTLAEKGYKVEYRQGKLVINDKVIISKKSLDSGMQEYVVEGVASMEFFEIRKLLYSNHIYI
jgi:cleavage and polyadenylation specificity factor subunit 2